MTTTSQYTRRIADARCPRCNRPNPDPTRVYCPDCRAYTTAMTARRRGQVVLVPPWPNMGTGLPPPSKPKRKPAAKPKGKRYTKGKRRKQ